MAIGLDGVAVGRAMHQSGRGDDRPLRVGAVVRELEGRDDGHAVADGDVRHALTDRLDDTRRLVPQCRGELWGVEVAALAEHRVRPVDADGVHPDQGLTRTGRPQLDLAQAQDLRTAGLGEEDLSGHFRRCLSERAMAHGAGASTATSERKQICFPACVTVHQSVSSRCGAG